MADEQKVSPVDEQGLTRRRMLAATGATGVAVVAGTAGAATQNEQRREFQPNRCSFADGIEAIRRARGEAWDEKAIVTSKDKGIAELMRNLQVRNIPDGFTKYQLPVAFIEGPGTQFYISIGAPGVQVPEHSHDEGDGLRYIVGGSIHYKEQELSSGDWMFIPKGARYSMEVGPLGAIMCYCYQCCCA